VTILGDGSLVVKIYYTRNTTEKLSITVTSKDASKSYDGTPLTCSEYEVSGSFAHGDKVSSVVVSGSLTNPGTVDNTISQVVIQDATGKPIDTITGTEGNYYTIVKKEGKLTVYNTATVKINLDDELANITGLVQNAAELILKDASENSYVMQNESEGVYTAQLQTAGIYHLYYRTANDVEVQFGNQDTITVGTSAENYNAELTLNYYSVKYYLDANKTSIYDTEIYRKGSSVHVITDKPTQVGLVLGGWKDTSNVLHLSGTLLTNDIDKPIALSAQWNILYLLTVNTYLDGVPADVETIHGANTTLYLKDSASLRHDLTKKETGIYTATLTTGNYYPYHSEHGEEGH
jgi:hypothetical protein